MICSYECTWCSACVDRLRNVAPNCGGFTPRPIGPVREWREGLSPAQRPPSTERVRMAYGWADAAEPSAVVADIAPAER